MKPILFLDFDGVLNSADYMAANPSAFDRRRSTWEMIDPMAVMELNWLIERSGASCVVSSTWRKLYPLSDLQRFLDRRGFTSKLLSCTPVKNNARGHEIQDWLNFYGYGESFVILDDDSDMVHLCPYLVKTSWKTGLTRHDCERALDVLQNGQEK